MEGAELKREDCFKYKLQKKEKKLEKDQEMHLGDQTSSWKCEFLPGLFLSFVRLHSQSVHVLPRSLTRGRCCQRDAIAGGSKTRQQ